jgi:hypothetical protein
VVVDATAERGLEPWEVGALGEFQEWLDDIVFTWVEVGPEEHHYSGGEPWVLFEAHTDGSVVEGTTALGLEDAVELLEEGLADVLAEIANGWRPLPQTRCPACGHTWIAGCPEPETLGEGGA